MVEIPIWVTILLNSLIIGYFVGSRRNRQNVFLGVKEFSEILAGTNPVVSGIAAGSVFLILPVIAFPLFGLGSLADRIFPRSCAIVKLYHSCRWMRGDSDGLVLG